VRLLCFASALLVIASTAWSVLGERLADACKRLARHALPAWVGEPSDDAADFDDPTRTQEPSPLRLV